MSPVSHRALVPINVTLYYAGWLACVVGAASGQWIAGALIGLGFVLLHLVLSTQPRTEVRLMVVVLLVGYSVDSIQTALGLLRFEAGQPTRWLAPLWIGVMWMLFSATLRYAFSWLENRPVLAALLGAAGGPAAFYAGLRLGAVRFHPTAGLSLVVLGVVWSVLFPALMVLTRAIAGPGPGYYRSVGK